MTKVLQHRNYIKIAENNLEFIRGDIWDLEIISWPSAVYYPGKDLIAERLNTVDPGMDLSVTALTKMIQGFEIGQSIPGPTNGQATLSFIDREDQAMTNMAIDWRYKVGDPDTGFGRHKSELAIRFALVFYNTLLKPLRRLDFYGGRLATPTIPNNTGEKGADLSDVGLALAYEHSKITLLNK